MTLLRDDCRPQIEASVKAHEAGIKEKINEKIWNHPELAFREVKAHDAICDYIESLGPEYKVTRHAYGINTSFEVEAATNTATPSDTVSPRGRQQQPRIVVFNAEYDALPNMVRVEDSEPPKFKPAHACGHNLIASSSVAAFIACFEALKAKGAYGPGVVVRLLGTPAEESGGGKLRLIEAGAYAGVTACLMVHPAPMMADRSIMALAFARSMASQRVSVEYEGQASHAGFAPWKGRNALDALMISYSSVCALRQQLLPSTRVNGIVTYGGKAANVVPAYTSMEFSIRAGKKKQLDELREKLNNCFQAGALATGCKATPNNTRRAYWNLISNNVLCDLFTKHMNGFGAKTLFDDPVDKEPDGSATDQGNVSHFCPAIEPTFFIESGGAVNHELGFADAAHTDEAFKRAMDCAKGLAAVGYEVLTDEKIADAVMEDFKLNTLDE